MKGLTAVPVLLLLALTPQPARASVVTELTFDATGIVAPVVLPFDFGTQPLGEISTVGFTVCFKQAASPEGSCDGGGRVSQEQGLAPPFYLAGIFRQDIATQVATPVNFPVDLAAGQQLIVVNQWVTNQVGPAADTFSVRGKPTGAPAENIDLNLMGLGVPSGPCVPGAETLCLNNDRFKIQSRFLTSAAAEGPASVQELTGDTGIFYFFSLSNVEAVIKVLNACSLPSPRYWVFAGGLTDVRTVVTVTDTQRDQVRTYINPQKSPYQPVQDTNAFATCP